ncbi:MAG: glycosyltransferase family 1 protein [candidate division WOR-3 bacterium]
MRIGINGLSIHGKSRRGGFWEYFYSLIKILEKVVQKEEIFVFINKKLREYFDNVENKNFKFVEIEIPEKISQYTEIFLLPFYLKKYKIKLLHFPTFAFPLYLKIPYIVTVHDLAFLKFKRNLGFHNTFYWRYIFRMGVRMASFIISVSENTKRVLKILWRIKGDKIKVIPSFSSLLISEKVEIDDSIIEKYGVKKPYFLFIGTLEPRKNLRNVLKAFLKVSEKVKDLNLLIIGQKGWEKEDLIKKIEENKDKVVWLSNIKGYELPAFYKNAIALLYPSLYEGFGLPILEAYKFLVPVITSNVSSLPEVAGKGALFVDPQNIEELEKNMIEIFYNTELREKLIQNQKEELMKYDYIKLGEKILSTYREVLLR